MSSVLMALKQELRSTYSEIANTHSISSKKNKAMKLQILVITFLYSAMSVAQISGSNIASSSVDNLLMLQQMDKKVRPNQSQKYDNVIGSVFDQNDFQEGFISIASLRFDHLLLKYNILEDAMLFKTKDQELYLDPQSKIDSVVIAKEVYFAKAYFSKNKPLIGFFLAKISGKAHLYVKKNISYREATAPKALESEGKPAEFIKLSDSYFLDISGQGLQMVSNTKDVLELLQKAELNQYAKKEKINGKKEEDLANLVRYYNSL